MGLPEGVDAPKVVDCRDAGGKRGGDPGCLLGHLVATIGPGFGHGGHYPLKGRQPVPVDLGVIGAGEEGLAFRSEPNRHGPSSVARHGLNSFHIDGIDVGSFLPINLYVYE